MDYLLGEDTSFCTVKGFVLFCFFFAFDINVKRALSVKMLFCLSTKQKMNLLVTTDSVHENELEAWIYFKGRSSVLKYPLLKRCSMSLKLPFSSASYIATLFR